VPHALLLAAALLGAPAPDARPSDPGAPLTLALVVASNRGAALDRPPLQYADDDGAKYRAVLAGLAGEENTTLLTAFDRDTARLFPALARTVEPPTRAALGPAVQRLAAAAQRARAAGRAVRFYFVFAGHGDVDAGRGFLELADGPFTSDDLEALLQRVGATESHVILDSCNSFFVVNPRKPGGRRFATPRDVAESLARRLPEVGVFLSTSAEAEVYEWSELQSGVFSHAVRSGLMGAADADGDGRVSYRELAAFVETAAAEIRNPAYRPRVFARGPGGDDGRPLADLSRLEAVAIRGGPPEGSAAGPGPLRLTVRDAEGLRWADAYVEEGQVLTLRLPPSLRGPLEVERLHTAGPELGRVAARYALPRTGDVALAALQRLPGGDAARGVADAFRGLFARPFGPRALAAWAEERAAAPEPVYGLSRADVERMSLLLEQLAATAREQRGRKAAFAGAYAAGGTAYYALSAFDRSLPAHDRISYAVSGTSLLAVGAGVAGWQLLRPTRRERAYERFRAAIAEPGADQVQVAADFDRQLHQIAGEERRARRRDTALAWSMFGLSAASVIFNEVAPSRERKSQRVVTRGAGVSVAALMLGVALQTQVSRSPTEQLIEAWERDPSRRPLELSVQPWGAGVMLAGRF
jgi:hypothetical protein